MENRSSFNLLEKARIIAAIRGYQIDGILKKESFVDVTASKADSNETLLMRILSNLKSKTNTVGTQEVKQIGIQLKEEDYDKVIVFGNRFTPSAIKELKEKDIEYFTKKQGILSSLNPLQQYSTLQDIVDKLCKIKCGNVPQSVDECKGYFDEEKPCTLCNGEGSTKFYAGRKRQCSICKGEGSIKKRTTCRIRSISDNADFHFTKNWLTLLKKDLRNLFDILLSSEPA